MPIYNYLRSRMHDTSSVRGIPDRMGDTSGITRELGDNHSVKRMGDTSGITRELDETTSIRGMINPARIRLRNRCFSTADGGYKTMSVEPKSNSIQPATGITYNNQSYSANNPRHKQRQGQKVNLVA